MSAPPVQLLPGLLISERIQLGDPIGQGGMGSVWSARHLGLNKQVAVKFVAYATGAAQVELRDRFLREAAAVSRIDNPHVVRTYDFGELADGTPYLVMELLQGESVEDRLGREGAVTPEVAARVIAQIASALTDAHAQGIIHRDIKPGNILLGRTVGELCAKLIDFGIAKDLEAASSSTKSGCMIGTPQYMSPERLVSAKEVDEQADIWGLAATAYEMLTGKEPFVGENVPQIIMAIRCRHYIAPSTHVSKATPGLAPLSAHTNGIDAVFERAFAVEKSQRFPTIAAFAEAFARACHPASSASWLPPSRPITEFAADLPVFRDSNAPRVSHPVMNANPGYLHGETVRAADLNAIAEVARHASSRPPRPPSMPPVAGPPAPNPFIAPPPRRAPPPSSHRTIGIVAIGVCMFGVAIAGGLLAASVMNPDSSTAGDSALAKDQKEDDAPSAAPTSRPSGPPPTTAAANTTPPVAVAPPGPTTTSAPFADPKPRKGSKPTGKPKPGEPPIDPKLGIQLIEEARKQVGLPPLDLPPPPPPQK